MREALEEDSNKKLSKDLEPDDQEADQPLMSNQTPQQKLNKVSAFKQPRFGKPDLVQQIQGKVMQKLNRELDLRFRDGYTPQPQMASLKQPKFHAKKTPQVGVGPIGVRFNRSVQGSMTESSSAFMSTLKTT